MSVPDDDVESGVDIRLADIYLSENILRTDLDIFPRRSTAKDHDGCSSLGPPDGLLQCWGEAGALDDDVETKLLAVQSIHGRGQAGWISYLEASVWTVL